MKMKIKLLSLAAMAAIVAGCSSDDENMVPVVDETKDTPITIASAGVAELIATRAADTNPLEGTSDSPATLGVFVTNGSDTKYDATNVQWQHAGTSWENKGTMMLYEGELSEQKIYAYSPYDANVTENGTITVTGGGTTDWLVATEASLAGSSVSLTMTHALAKLVLEPSFGTDVTDRTINSVKVDGMYASGTLNIADNTWALGENPTTTELTMDSKNELLVIPMAQCESFVITVVTGDDRTFETTISLSGVENKLEAGTQYNITL